MVVHLVDGTYELFRHFYGLRRFRVKGSASRGLGKKWILLLIVTLLLIPAMQMAVARLTLSLPLTRPLGWKARPRLRLRYGPIYVARFPSAPFINPR